MVELRVAKNRSHYEIKEMIFSDKLPVIGFVSLASFLLIILFMIINILDESVL